MRNSSPNRKKQRGAAIILLTLMLTTVLLPMVGLGIDGALLYIVKAKLSAAVDGGAIAAARSLSAGLTFDSQKTAAELTAQQFVKANFPNGFWNTSNLTFPTPIEVKEDTSTSVKRRTVAITANVDVPLIFMRILGHNKATVSAYGKAARRDVRLVLVLDRSSSMSGAISALKNAAADFVNRFAEGRDQVGLVVFGVSGIVAFPNPSPNGPQNTFKSANPNVTGLIGMMNSGSNTGMAEGLWLAYQELKKSPLPGALNLIVMFTDGLPNGITGYFNNPANNVIKITAPASTCPYPTATTSAEQVIGAISQHEGFNLTGKVAGIYQLMSGPFDTHHPDVKTWMSSAQERTLVNGAVHAATNCYCYNSDGDANKYNVKQDLNAIPSLDYYGNKTNAASYTQSKLFKSQNVPQNLTNVGSPYQIGLASWSAADDVASRIRSDTDLIPVIYTIGLYGGTETPDDVLMKRISNVNDPANTSYDSTKPSGLFVMSPTPAQLAAAFGRVASEILRLTN
jgi:Flp pilus assembly protein TadG